MIDQADYTGIDTYIKRHGLNDASLAASRRAQVYNVNVKGEKNGEVANGTAGDDEEEESELQKAERLMQDVDDEEEEDYDPGSEGESEGEGSSSEEEAGDGKGPGNYTTVVAAGKPGCFRGRASGSAAVRGKLP